MSREIKFRAYDTRLKMWCYDGEPFTIFGEVLLVDGFSSHFIENPTRDSHGNYLTSLERIADIELMQYTGLKDKNGKEIYEGDIVVQDGKNYVINFKAGSFGIDVEPTNRKRRERILSSSSWEVIGNEFENPELLKP